MLVLLGVLVVVVGFALRLNAMLVVTVAGIVTGFLGHMSPIEILNAFGTGFASSRSIAIFLLVLPVIGLVERYGLQEQSRRLIAKLGKLTTGRVLASYMVVRQLTCALGLLSIGGHAQSVRPIVAPMAEAAAEKRHGQIPERVSERIRAYSASTDNVAAFFSEDIFVAVGAVLLITSFVDATYHFTLAPLQVALWAIPTAICALLIHGARMLWLDRSLARELGRGAEHPADRAADSAIDRAADSAIDRADQRADDGAGGAAAGGQPAVGGAANVPNRNGEARR